MSSSYLEELIMKANYCLRQLTFHTDGTVTAKAGASSPKPKKIYNGKTAHEAIEKLIKDQRA